MIETIDGDGKTVDIKSWVGEGLDFKTFEQAKNLAKLPFIHRHVALMPDAHMGYGMPIGGVIGTNGVVIPNAVGVDIGCGMAAIKTSLVRIDQYPLRKIMGRIRDTIPVGFKKHDTAQDLELMPQWVFSHKEELYPVVSTQFVNARKSLGTLGGGNHFIEIQRGTDGGIWIMVHSGSRNLGLQVANFYNNKAKELNKRWHSGIDEKAELNFLPLNSEEGDDYIREMQYCIDFAEANRREILNRIEEAFKAEVDDVEFYKRIDVSHNYARMENHMGKNVMIHRKGAISAKSREIGIIPSSQGTPSYITLGKGETLSFKSSSHGAGRRLGRKQAQKSLNIVEERALLEGQGIIHSVRTEKDLDEATGAYKDIDKVMKNQHDLVTIIETLQPLANIKG